MNRRVPLIAGGVVVLLLLIWFVALWRPATTNANKALASRTAAETLQTTLGGRLSSLLALQKSLPSEEAKLRQGQVAVPTSISLDSVIDQINAVAVADQISWTNESQSSDASSAPVSSTTVAPTSSSTAAAGSSATTPSSVAAVSTSGDSTLTLSLQVAGNYTNMAKFITDLEHRPRLIVIDTLGYSPGANSTVTVSMGARAFYNPTASPTVPNGS